MSNVILQIILLLACILLTALFSGMETAVISLNRVRLQHLLRNKVRGAKEMDFFLRNPEQLLGTTLIGTNLCTVICSVTAASISADFFGAAGSWISGAVMTVTLLIFSEYLPKAWFQSSPALRGRHFAPLLRIISRILHPAVQALMILCRLLFPISGRSSTADHIITKDELKHLTMETERTGVLSTKERQMIHGVFELGRKTCRDIMTPRSEMVLISASMSCGDLLDLARRRNHNRYPVYRDTPEHIVGIANVLDAATDPFPAGKTAADYMRAPQFIAVQTPPDEVLARMRHSHQPIAVVTGPADEIMGLVTLEDVLEEIIGINPKNQSSA